jgi:serine/threonine-protein kinase
MPVDPREQPTVEKTARVSVTAGDVPPPPPSLDAPSVSAAAVRYLLGDEIGHGGMGAVLRAHDDRLNRDLAVKMLHASLLDSPGLRRRFNEEAQIAGQLQHPGVVPVYDLGLLPDGRPFFAMKLVKGRTLAELLAERPDPSHDLPRFLKVFEQVCQTMAYAHSRHVLHRDLKPGNVMVGAFGEVQVMDWGIAKVLDNNAPAPPVPAPEPKPGEPLTEIRTERFADPEQATMAGSILGTYPYMAPEQARGETDRLDERTDVFSLGAILCEILTGHPPYVGQTREELRVLALVGDQTAAQARLASCGADAELIALVSACLASDRERRPRDAGAVAAAVTGYLDGVQRRLRQAESERAAAEVRAREEGKRRRLAVGLAAAVLLTVLSVGTAGLIVQQLRQRQEEQRRQQEREQRQQTARVVDQALGQATALRDQAREAPIEEQSQREQAAQLWRQAVAAGDRAEQALGAGPADDEVRQRVAQLLTELRSEAAEAEKDRTMLHDLETARDQAGALQESDYLRHRRSREIVYGLAASPAYARAFRDYGIDIEKLSTEEAADRIRARRIAPRLADALDAWYFIDPDAAGGRLLAVSQLADPQPLRNALRRAVAAGDVATLQRLAAEDPTLRLPPSSLILLADVLCYQGFRQEAIDLLGRTRRRYPKDFWLHLVSALHLANGDPPDFEEADRCCAAAIVLRPDSPLGWANRGANLHRQGRYEEAILAYRESLRHQDFIPTIHQLIRTLPEVNETEEARRELERALERHKDSAMLRTMLADLLAREDDLDGAVRTYLEVIRQHPHWAYAYVGLADLLLHHDSQPHLWLWRDCIIEKLLDDAEKLGEDLPDLNAARGDLWERRGDLARAIAAYRRETRLNPRQPRGWWSLGGNLRDSGSEAEAIAAWRQAADLIPGDAYLRAVLANALMVDKQPLEAITEATAALRLYRRQNLVRVAHSTAAGQTIGQAFESLPSTGEAREALGWALLEQERYAEAAEEFRLSTLKPPADAYAYNGLGLARSRQGQKEEAVAALREAVRLQPDNANFHNDLGNAYAARNQFAEAADCYRKAREVAPRRFEYPRNIGLVELWQGHWSEAEDAFRTAVKCEETSAEAHLGLGQLQLRRGEVDEAAVQLRRATELQRENAAAHSWYGEALRRQGHAAEAVEEARQAVRLAPKDAGMFYRLGDALTGGGSFEEALAAYLHGRQLNESWGEIEPLDWTERIQASRRNLELDLLGADRRFRAAGAAVRAARPEREPLDEVERSSWRRQALLWLQADLAAWNRELDDATFLERIQVRAVLLRWKQAPTLAAVREAKDLERLPEDERAAWRALWQAVDAALRRCD